MFVGTLSLSLLLLIRSTRKTNVVYVCLVVLLLNVRESTLLLLFLLLLTRSSKERENSLSRTMGLNSSACFAESDSDWNAVLFGARIVNGP